ncbi:hypothetical protein ACFSGI_16630 [Paenibacillus nicotianae]|uniref:Uncharacterized protein n=1 Tax=Paenibacillus nicotianae TaxID=1526551 RepID=A0ABW4UX68_9BACL
MNKRATGTIFLSLGLLLIIGQQSLRFLVASAMTFHISGMSNTAIQEMLTWTPTPYNLVIPIIFLIIGIGYLLWSELNKE